MKNNFQLSKLAASLAVMGGMSLFSGQLMAAAPLAGTNISNVATASYTDNTGTQQVVTSNEVKTLVAQIGGFTLEADRSAQTTANGQVTFSHILTNTGNGSDKFSINLENLSGTEINRFDFESTKFAIYIDRNKDGIADNKIALNVSDRIELAAGESVGLVIIATTPSTATQGQFDTLKVTATADSTTLYSTATKNNIDTTTITTGAVMQITKAASVSIAQAGQEIEYTLTFKNTGNTAATNVAIFDVLPATVQFVAGSARYSGSSVALTDAKDTTDKFELNGNRFLYNIDSIAANTSGKLTFKVRVLDSTSAGDIKNTAYVDPDGKAAGPLEIGDIPTLPNTPPTDSTTVPSNPSIVTVTGKYDAAINDSVLNNFKDGATPTPTSAVDDRITLAGKQGVPVIFGDSNIEGDMIVVHNRGNSTDSYTLTVNKDNLPLGSIVEILKADGKTPVTANSTGPIAAGGYEKYVVRVTFKNGALVNNNTVVLTSTSEANKGSDTLTLVVSSLDANSVDLVSKPLTGTELGIGAGTNGAVSSVSTAPATAAVFDITIKNTGNIPDNYIINVPNIPNGWTVEVFEKDSTGNCTATKLTNSGNIANGTEKSFCLMVTPPAGAAADTVTGQNIKVEISSPATGSKDDITFNVKVAEQRQLTFTPDRQGQIAPGGTIVYSHTLTNAGNILEGVGASYPIEINWNSTLQGANTSVYVDLNNDGQLTADELITGNSAFERNASLLQLLAKTGNAGLSQNEAVSIIVKVEAPATATAGESDTTSVTFTATGTNKPAAVTVTDRTIINLGQVRLVKTQGLSANCSDQPTAYVSTNLAAKPGQCVYYKIVASNDGNANATNVVISDTVPSYTKLYGTVEPTGATQSNGQISYNVGMLTPAASATLKFAVKVDGLITP